MVRLGSSRLVGIRLGLARQGGVRLTWPRFLLALVSGLALAFAFPSYRVPGLAWVSLAALLVAALGARGWVALVCGMFHGVAFYTASLPWIYTVMRMHGGLSPLAAGAVLALLATVCALFPALFCWCVAAVGKASVPQACLLAPFLWVGLEFVRTHGPLGGFPWNLLGYAAADQLGLLQLAAATGIYGVSFVLAGYNALLAWLVETGTRRAWLAWLGATAVLLPVGLWGHRFVPTLAAERVAHLVQTNFPQATSYPADWLEQHKGELDELEALSISAARQLPGMVIWPEVPAPFSLQDPRFAMRAEQIARAAGNYFLVGVVNWKPGRAGGLAPYNAAALLDPSGRLLFLYDKIHLVPFGEYVPLRRWLTFAGKLTAEVGDFQPGSVYAVGKLPGGTCGVFICFEAIFPGEVRRFVTGGPASAALLINLSNDGWFGRSSAPEQHLMMARVRAVESRRWLLRGTNTGYTVAVDPYGRERARLEPDRRSVLAAPYDFRSDRTLYSQWGDWWAWLCLFVTVALIGSSVMRPRSPGK